MTQVLSNGKRPASFRDGGPDRATRKHRTGTGRAIEKNATVRGDCPDFRGETGVARDSGHFTAKMGLSPSPPRSSHPVDPAQPRQPHQAVSASRQHQSQEPSREAADVAEAIEGLPL
jgi:hypothetical protein